MYFIYDKYKRNLKDFFKRINQIFSVKYVTYGYLKDSYENNFLKFIEKENIYNMLDDKFSDDDTNYYLDPLNIFYNKNSFMSIAFNLFLFIL